MAYSTDMMKHITFFDVIIQFGTNCPKNGTNFVLVSKRHKTGRCEMEHLRSIQIPPDCYI